MGWTFLGVFGCHSDFHSENYHSNWTIIEINYKIFWFCEPPLKTLAPAISFWCKLFANLDGWSSCTFSKKAQAIEVPKTTAGIGQSGTDEYILCRTEKLLIRAIHIDGFRVKL